MTETTETPRPPEVRMTDILAAIDQAIGCQQCTGPLGCSPSGDFCSEACQRTWHAGRVGAHPDLRGGLDTREWRQQLRACISELHPDRLARRIHAAAVCPVGHSDGVLGYEETMHLARACGIPDAQVTELIMQARRRGEDWDHIRLRIQLGMLLEPDGSP